MGHPAPAFRPTPFLYLWPLVLLALPMAGTATLPAVAQTALEGMLEPIRTRHGCRPWPRCGGGPVALDMTVDWAPNPLLQHSGSNGLNYAQIWLEPRRDLAMVMLTNIGGETADAALRAVAKERYGRFAGAAQPVERAVSPR